MDTYMLAAREKGAIAGGHRIPAPSWIDGPAIVAGAPRSTETTAQVHPPPFTAALLDAARARGAAPRSGVVEAGAPPRPGGPGGPRGGPALPRRSRGAGPAPARSGRTASR